VPAENRERVLRPATSSFLARGAGVANQTVYAHFPSTRYDPTNNLNGGE
jgi:hypothetical protein